MKKITKLLIVIALIAFITSCGDGSKDGNAVINNKKAALEKLKATKTKTDEGIAKLQEELSKLDSNADNSKIKLVGIAAVGVQDFKHYIDLQGRVDAENISYISPRGMGGQVKAIFVKQGQRVSKGQLLLKLDDAIMRQSVVAARQQLQGIKTQLNLAKDLYNRQKNLWDQGIGTQVQLLTAKTNVEGLENQLSSAGEQVKVSVEQQNTSNVYSDVSGIADIVNIKVGETFSGMTATGPQIKIVNNSSLKVVTNVPENYISRLKKGTPVVISIPDVNKTINAAITLISQSVDLTSRGFIAEVKIPADPALKPNQSAVVKILDYSAPAAVVIPVNTVQSDEKNKYVYVLEKNSKGKPIAKKKIINIGDVYGELVEIKSGLAAGEQLITEGYQNLYEGQLVGTDVK
ncbi:MAG: efflux RND transporter periplasmic adaptor subunit [Ferruginibacter sp.]|nr:efflux RND transporter periplasmic adaptor subunit [Ferruginibacter sp.]